MCFSAEASFTVAAVLAPAGFYSAARAMRRNCSFLPLAVLPLIFSVQQVSEGCVWYGIEQDNAALVQGAALVFLFFAIPFWLFWIPFCLLFIEPRKSRKLFFGVVLLGGLVGGMVPYLPVFLNPELLNVQVLHHSIQYNIPVAPLFQYVPQFVWQAPYLLIVASPLIGTSLSKNFIGFGVVLVVSAVVSYLFYWYAFTSVWCFFAAILSFFMCFFFGNLPAAKRKPADAQHSARLAPSSGSAAGTGV